MSDEPIVYAFHQDGTARLLGVPPKSLTQREFDRLDPAAKREVLASPMYREVKAAKADTKKSDATASGGES